MRQLKNLHGGLRELRPILLSPQRLITGRDFKNFKMRPRELLGNWLLAAVLAFDSGNTGWTIVEDPDGRDGWLINPRTKRRRQTEHIYIPAHMQASKTVEELIVQFVAKKVNRGHGYAAGKALVVFSEASGEWFPNRTRWLLVGQHSFTDIWVLHPEHITEKHRTYCVALLTELRGSAPAWRVIIPGTFDDWHVWRVQ